MMQPPVQRPQTMPVRRRRHELIADHLRAVAGDSGAEVHGERRGESHRVVHTAEFSC